MSHHEQRYDAGFLFTPSFGNTSKNNADMEEHPFSEEKGYQDITGRDEWKASLGIKVVSRIE